VETGILREHASALADFCGASVTLLEYGAGAGIKTELLLKALRQPSHYVPIDIAVEFLDETAARIRRRFPGLDVRPIVADFMGAFAIPASLRSARCVGFFPGSTIGNLERREAVLFLTRMRGHVGASGGAIVGVDLVKNLDTLLSAYDDRSGITATFNLNLLVRINRELSGDFRIDRFEHCARWNERESAVEMHLVSTVPQTVRICGRAFSFAAGETIHTESSRKYSISSFTSLAMKAGWKVQTYWMDTNEQFAIFALNA
jgi:dimethylhistidine N-methyltransferase